VLVDGAGTAPDEVAGLRDEGGFEVVYLSPRLGRTQVRSKRSLLISILFPNVLKYRAALRGTDVVVVGTWYLLPLLALQRLRLVERPKMIVSLNLFIQSERAERIGYGLVGLLKLDNLWVATSSTVQAERSEALMKLPPGRTKVLPFRNAGGLPAKVGSNEGFVFTGGYTNRDYDTFIAAVRPLTQRVVVQALPSNEFAMEIPANVEIDTRFGPDLFEQLLGASSVVVLPLYPKGTTCGQSVLLQALQYGKPVIATAHPGLFDMVAADSPGYVPAGDVDAMREAIEKALTDDAYRAELERISRDAQRMIDSWSPIHAEMRQFIDDTLAGLDATEPSALG
jgi:glycosyltransferase involved in cell wall biosynthesis